MKILYDSQIFSLQKFGGISRYIYELLSHKTDEYEAVLAGKYLENEYLKDTPYYKKLLLRETKYKKYLINELNKRYSNKLIKNGEYDIFHATYYDTYFLHVNKKPFVIDAHDMIQELFPMNTMAQKAIRKRKSILMHKADAILAVSENTKNDVLKLYPDIDADKIHVCYRGSFWHKIDKVQKKKDYILYTGQRSYYKNFKPFIIAVSPILQKYNLHLICTGSPFTKDEKCLIQENHVDTLVSCRFATDNELQTLYSQAICFIYPSLYEGFGLPILEAWASGCPLALSNTSCFPEIASEAGFYFDPYNIDDMRNKIDTLITNKSLQNELIEKGFARLSLFQWKDKIKQTADIYKSLLR